MTLTFKKLAGGDSLFTYTQRTLPVTEPRIDRAAAGDAQRGGAAAVTADRAMNAPVTSHESLFLVGADPQLLDLARERVAAEAQQVCGLDAPAAGLGERPQDERFLERRVSSSMMPVSPRCEQRSTSFSSALAQCCIAGAAASARSSDGRSFTSIVDRRRHHRQPVAEVLELAHVAGQDPAP